MPAALRSLAPFFVFAAVYATLALVITNSYYQLMMTLVLVWASFGLAWNLLSGYTGLVSFGHAAFFGIGAYTTALGQIHFDLSPWLLIPVAAVLGGVAGLLIGIPTFRLRGVYFALSMLAYPLALLYVFEWLGYQEVTLPMKRESAAAYMQFADHRIYTLLALALLAMIVVMTRMIEQSRFGMALLAIKQNEAAAEAAGINTLKWKLLAITLSGAIAGFGTGADRYAVRRRRDGLGAGDRLRDPDPGVGDSSRGARPRYSRHPERDLRFCHRGADPGRAGRHLLEGTRLRLPALAGAGRPTGLRRAGAGDRRHARHPRGRSALPEW
jgi:branched-subunit amino acid ABC-type transport system permease component